MAKDRDMPGFYNRLKDLLVVQLDSPLLVTLTGRVIPLNRARLLVNEVLEVPVSDPG